MNYFILAISMLACLIAGMTKKRWGNRHPENTMMTHLFNAATSAISALALWIATGFRPLQISPFTLCLGILFGVVTAVQAIFHLKAFEKGPFSYTTVIVSLSTIIPALSGFLFWNEQIAPIQLVGILLMLMCFVCSVDNRSTEKKASLIWFLYVGLAFLFTGFIGILQKWHQNTEYSGELDAFLIIAFAISFLYSTSSLLYLYFKNKNPDSTDFATNRKQILTEAAWFLLAGICIAANNKFNLYLSGVMDSAVFFPTVNGGNLILSTVVALLIFREKPSRRQWIGIALGTAAVILLCNPF